MFNVCAFHGDFPLSDQPNWGAEYESLREAVKEAIRRYEWLRSTYASEHDNWQKENYCVTVEIGDGTNDRPEFVIGRPSVDLF